MDAQLEAEWAEAERVIRETPARATEAHFAVIEYLGGRKAATKAREARHAARFGGHVQQKSAREIGFFRNEIAGELRLQIEEWLAEQFAPQIKAWLGEQLEQKVAALEARQYRPMAGGGLL